MIRFSRLRLTGFKSFVDTTEVAIEAGMTGIVGPNGCGKSNLVEALRWVMGEASAKQMRGGEMDDIIFAGSSSRPRRDVAEVAVVLEDLDKTLPAPFGGVSEIEIRRRIERGEGSTYRVNGREVRARDVQTLFADLASGARSTAIVGQGHIGAIISARPADRRSILEEAAGISGLHSRRHEAELRLRAAETNLERLADMMVTLDERWQGLKRQARHAARYRNLSQRIREAEALLLTGQWREARDAAARAVAELDSILGKVADLTGIAAQAATRQAEAQTALPALRQAEAEAAAKTQRLTQALRELDAEEARLAEQKRAALQRLAQTGSDLDRERLRAADAAEARKRLAAERAALEASESEEAGRQQTAQQLLSAAEAEAARVEGEVTQMMERVAAVDAERAQALRRSSECEDRTRRLAQRQADLAQQIARADQDVVDPAQLNSAEMDKEEAEEYLASCRQRAEATEAERADALARREAAQQKLQALNAQRSTLIAEADGLRAALAEAKGNADEAPVIDALSTVAGYETALGAALGDDLSAPIDTSSPRRWTTMPPLDDAPALPDGATPLSAFVTAPTALARRLSQIGLVDDAKSGEALRGALKVGQRLVDRDGHFWRWDGYFVAAGAPSAAIARLRQRARLRELELAIADGALGVEEAKAATEQALRAGEAAAIAEREARDAVRKAEIEVKQATEAHLKLAQKAAQAGERLAVLKGQETSVATEAAEAAAALEDARQRVAAFADGGEDRERLAVLRAELAEKRTQVVEARSQLERLKSEAQARARRLEALANEEKSWAQRAAGAERQIAELEGRRAKGGEEIAALEALPQAIGDKRQILLDEATAAQKLRSEAADALALGERMLADADRLAREAETALGHAREERARCEAKADAATKSLREIAQRVREKLGAEPETLTDAQQQPADQGSLSEQLDRLLREREAMGPVNLMAEDEAEETKTRIDTLTAERDDLLAAIAKLRHGINEINREGRERLRASFDIVDKHFRTLFVRLFGGGKAYLTLTNAEDPLQAGLEIMASPPGKRLQMLSLLSGGEQALTALSLLFAVFMTNPAPVCVLDEVDAPLDDANVDRFCNLVAEMTESAGTRFLVVTHHRMTMARMHRLYGVTMGERGVSTLVSVNLQKAEELAETA